VLAERGGLGVVAGAEHARVPRCQQPSSLLILGGGGMVSDVSSDQDRIQVVGEVFEVVHDGLGAVGAALTAVDVDVAEVGDHDHRWGPFVMVGKMAVSCR